MHWLAGRRLNGLWIMPDEAIYAERALGFWRHFTLPVLHGQGAGYSVLYPIVAGIPLAVGSVSRGYDTLKLLQALVMSLTAVPLFWYGRRVMSNGYALLAGTLAVSSPLLIYSGLVMTEVLYYPLTAFALLAIAHAIDSGRLRHQAVAFVVITAAMLTRVQAVVLVAIFAAAALVDAAFARDPRRLRAFWPVWALIGLVALAVVISPAVFGAYAGTLSGGYPAGQSLRLVYDHLAYIVLEVAVAPFAALLVLVGLAAGGRERDPKARALIAVALCATVLVSVQVGLFAARFAPHLLGRDLAALPPILFVVFALWLDRGCPRPKFIASGAVIATAAIVIGAPWNSLVERVAVPDTLGIALFLRHTFATPASLIAVGAAVALLLFRFLPRGASIGLAAVVFAMLAISSVAASNTAAQNVRFSQRTQVGTPRDWIEKATSDPVAYVYNGDSQSWNVVWQQRFWNPRITQVVSLAPNIVPGPMSRSTQIQIPNNGKLGTDARYVVANDRDAFAGTQVAHQDRGTEDYGLTLWRVDAPARLSTITHDVKPNGDIMGNANVTAFDCRGGRLLLTLIPKATDTVTVSLDGQTILNAHIGGLMFWNGTAYVPASHTSDRCDFTITGGLLLGSTQIAFQPAGG